MAVGSVVAMDPALFATILIPVNSGPHVSAFGPSHLFGPEQVQGQVTSEDGGVAEWPLIASLFLCSVGNGSYFSLRLSAMNAYVF